MFTGLPAASSSGLSASDDHGHTESTMSRRDAGGAGGAGGRRAREEQLLPFTDGVAGALASSVTSPMTSNRIEELAEQLQLAAASPTILGCFSGMESSRG